MQGRQQQQEANNGDVENEALKKLAIFIAEMAQFLEHPVCRQQIQVVRKNLAHMAETFFAPKELSPRHPVSR
jgi:hypothetical protein